MLGAAISYSSDGSHRSDERSQVEVEGTRNSLEAVPDDLVHLQHFIRSFLRIRSPGKQKVLSQILTSLSSCGLSCLISTIFKAINCNLIWSFT